MAEVKTFFDLVDEWEHAKEAASFFKKEERRLREEIVQASFAANKLTLKEGVNTLELVNGGRVKVTHTITRSVDVATYLAMRDGIGEAAFNALIRHKPELNTAIYKQAQEPERNYIDNFLIIKPGAPTLEVIRGN